MKLFACLSEFKWIFGIFIAFKKALESYSLSLSKFTRFFLSIHRR